MKHGLLLINLGTPEAPNPGSVKKYLKEFLLDRHIIDLPAPVRYLLFYTLILPLRLKRSTQAYQAIWTEQGSPLRLHTMHLAEKLNYILHDQYKVAVGMRYGQPSIESALDALQSCNTLTVLPLYPQYSQAATGSSIEKVLSVLHKRSAYPSLRIIRDFYEHPGFIVPMSNLIKPYLHSHDHLLFSYHGLPERQVIKCGCKNICIAACPAPIKKNTDCYRAQCYATSHTLAQTLGLSPKQFSVTFQSRLGKTPWIKPYTDTMLPELAKQGIKRLAVAFPSFVADCLETLEEIDIRARKQWLELGGEQLTCIPCLNDHEDWVKGITDICGY